MIIIGVTGGMGSGKSSVCNILGKLGVKIIEADKVAKSLYSIEPKLKNKIIESFGSNVLDDWGEVSFKNLAEAAFKDDDSVALLNQITHPFIRDAMIIIIQVSNLENSLRIRSNTLSGPPSPETVRRSPLFL